tara:strand:- start:366 stop:569 length:204 start_codon:yes stop_codon:yes gene_type:complete
MDKLLDPLIDEFKKLKKDRGDLFKNFLGFCYEILENQNDDKYKDKRLNILRYIVANKTKILLKLTKN